MPAASQPPAHGAPPGERTVTIFSHPDCHLCELALAAARRLQAAHGFALVEVDVTRDEALHRAYFERVPVIALDGEELCEYVLDEALLAGRLGGSELLSSGG